jgi:DNA invertase Pin-like site-specific DNA recombinase
VSLDGIAAVGYCRVSTDRQAGEKQTSLEDQTRAIESLATKRGISIGRWYRDEGASGGTVAGRPQLRALIADCLASPRKAKRPGYVLVLNDSRWGRFPNPDQAAALRWQLDEAGWLVRFVEGDESEDPTMRHVMRAIGGAQASEYRRNVQRNARRGSRGTAEQGFWATRAPYGYRRKVVYPPGRERILEAHQRKASDEKVALTPHATEAAIVHRLFTRYATGTESIASVTEWLRETAPERKWACPGVKYMLRSPAYVGDVVSGRFSSEHRETRPESEWVTHRNAHPAIIDRALFARCQDVLARNAKWTTRVRTDWIVSGIVRCPCGKPYVAGGGNYKRAGKPSVLSYRCITKAGLIADRCPYPGTVKKEWLERAVIDTVASVVGSAAQRRRIHAHLNAEVDARRSQPADALASLSTAITEASATRDRLVAAVADGTLTGDEAKARLTTVRRQIARLESQRDALVPTVETTRAIDAERDAIAAQVLDFRAMASALRGPALRELIRPWIASAAFDPISREMWLDVRHFPALTHGALSSMPRRSICQSRSVSSSGAACSTPMPSRRTPSSASSGSTGRCAPCAARFPSRA